MYDFAYCVVFWRWSGGYPRGAIPWCWDYYSKVLEGTLVLCAFARTKPDALQGVLLGRSGI